MFRFRPATEADAELIVEFLRAHAEFEQLGHIFAATAEMIRDNFFRRGTGEIFFGMDGEREAAMLLFYENFSPFLGTPCLVVNNLFVRPEYQGSGWGRAMLAHAAAIAVERGCLRCEWTCSRWNSRAIAFYQNHGAYVMDDRDEYRIDGQALLELAALDAAEQE